MSTDSQIPERIAQIIRNLIAVEVLRQEGKVDFAADLVFVTTPMVRKLSSEEFLACGVDMKAPAPTVNVTAPKKEECPDVPESVQMPAPEKDEEIPHSIKRVICHMLSAECLLVDKDQSGAVQMFTKARQLLKRVSMPEFCSCGVVFLPGGKTMIPVDPEVSEFVPQEQLADDTGTN